MRPLRYVLPPLTKNPGGRFSPKLKYYYEIITHPSDFRNDFIVCKCSGKSMRVIIKARVWQGEYELA